MAKTLYIVDDEVFDGLPEPAQKKLVSEVTDLFSFVPGFTVKTLPPLQFPGTVLHFTDSVVSLIEQDIDMDAVLRDIRKKETANVQASIQANHLNLTINTAPQSFAGTLEAMGVGGQWKTVTTVNGKKVSIGMTYGVASLESAEEAFLEEFLHGRKADDIRAQRKDKQRKDANWPKTAEGQQSTRDLAEAELLSKHKPLSEWPRDQWETVATVLARIVAHEARHQYIDAHSSAGLGADSARVWGDPHYEAFDGTDQANLVTKINDLTTNWNTADIHLETCPQQAASPFA